MNVSSRFLRFASICALVTALTTLAIHLLPELWADADTFENNFNFGTIPSMRSAWVIIVHCLLVIVSMFGLGVQDCSLHAGSYQVWIPRFPLLWFHRNSQNVSENLCA